MKKIFITLCLLAITMTSLHAFTMGEALWNNLLERHTEVQTKDSIKTNLVDYQGLRSSQSFQTILRILKNFDTTTLSTKEEKLAFWINAYNIAAIKMIIDNYPLKSIKEKSTLFKAVWDLDIIDIGGKTYSLGHIEHNILRKLDDPRIHFAIVCASLSCPDIRSEAYTAKKLNTQLEEQTYDFIANKTKGFRIRHNTKTIELSQIFKWFKADFKNHGGIHGFISKYSKKPVPRYSRKYLKYSWKLNEQ